MIILYLNYNDELVIIYILYSWKMFMLKLMFTNFSKTHENIVFFIHTNNNSSSPSTLKLQP